MLTVLAGVMRRDLVLAWRRPGDALQPALFLMIVAALFPLGVGPDPELLRSMGPGVLWVAALLASLLGLGRLFAHDHADGTLEQMLLSPQPLALIVLAKVAVHWLVAGLPLVLLAPLLALQYDMEAAASRVLWLGLLIGTPVLGLLGAVGEALALGARGGSMLVALLVLPLYVPVLILGAGAVGAQLAGIGAHAHLALLGAMLCAALALAPWATGAALRIAVE
jgi:heme exporter protein B